MLFELGRTLASHGRPFVILGDWNMAPEDVNALGLPERLCATLVHAKECTCHSSTCVGTVARHLDFLLVSDALVSLIHEVSGLSMKPRPRGPVRIRFKSFRYITTVRVPCKKAPLPADRPFGPDVRHDWTAMLELQGEERLQLAKEVIATESDGGVGFVRSLIHRWECLAEKIGRAHV